MESLLSIANKLDEFFRVKDLASVPAFTKLVPEICDVECDLIPQSKWWL